MTNNFDSEYLRAIVETVVDGIITISDKGIIETVNPATENLFGYTALEMLGHNISMLMPEPYSSEHDQYISNFLRSGEAKVIGKDRELVGQRKDGSTFAMELAVNAMKVADQRKFTGIVRDISARKTMENNLRASETRVRAILDTVLDSIITINSRGNIETINPATVDLFGYTPEELKGKNIRKLMPEPYNSNHDSYLDNYNATGDKKIIGKDREVMGRRKDGSTFPMELAVNEMQLEGQTMFTGVIRDISERKRIDKLRQNFIATVSHELRTPLTSIRGSLGLLNSEKILNDKKTMLNLLSIAEANTFRLLVLINDLLDFQKIQAGKMEYNFAEIDLLHLISSSVEECQHYAQDYNVKIAISEVGKNQTIYGDIFRLAQVLANLLSNAIKFSPAESYVEIGVIDVDDHIKIYVKDKGNGIPEEFRSRIFSEFSQSDNSNTRQFSGTGLGLSISKAIVDEHGGSIYFESTIGTGTTFYVELFKSITDAKINSELASH